MTLYLIAAGVGLVIVAAALILRRQSRALDEHVEQAMELANERHPSRRGRRCHCGGRPHTEPWHHGVRCYPLREYLGERDD